MMRVTVVVPFSRPENWPLVVENFARQTHGERRLLIVENGRAVGAPRPELPHGTTVIRSEPTPARARNRGIAWMRERDGGAVSFQDDDDYYGPGYLAEVAAVLGGNPRRASAKAFRYVRFDDGLYYCLAEQTEPAHGPTISGFAEHLPDFPLVHLEDAYYSRELERAGIELRALSSRHYVYNRRARRGRELDITQRQFMRAFGPARRLGDVPDAVADIEESPAGEFVHLPTWDEIFEELAQSAPAAVAHS